jgi:integrase
MAGEASCWSSRRPSEDPRQPGRLSLPAFAVDALRAYQHLHRQRTRLRLRLRLLQVQPGPTHDRSTSTYCCAPSVAHRSPRACQPGVPGPRQDAGIDAHPHLLRHSLASAMAAAKEPASVIAGQLRHADGGTLASRTYIHQLPQTPPRLARLIEDRYGPAARQARSADRR